MSFFCSTALTNSSERKKKPEQTKDREAPHVLALASYTYKVLKVYKEAKVYKVSKVYKVFKTPIHPHT